jgi:hypothetical protein
MDCLKRQETLLAISEASRGPSIYCTREAVHDTQASRKGKGRQRSEAHQSIMMDTKYIRGVMVMETKRVS